MSRRHRVHPPVTPSTFSRSTPPTPRQPASENPSEPATDILRRSNSFQDTFSSSTQLPSTPNGPTTPPFSSPTSSRSQSPSIGFFRSASLSKDFAPTSNPSSSEPLSTAYPSSPPPSPPPIHSSPSGSFIRSLPPFQSLRLEHSSSSVSSNSSCSPPPSFRTAADFDFSSPVAEEERDDPFDYKSVQNLPSFDLDSRAASPSPHPTTTSLPSRFSYALLSPVLPPHPSHTSSHHFPLSSHTHTHHYPVFSRRAQRATIAVNEHTFHKSIDPDLAAILQASRAHPPSSFDLPPTGSLLASSVADLRKPSDDQDASNDGGDGDANIRDATANGNSDSGSNIGVDSGVLPIFAPRAKANTSPSPSAVVVSPEMSRSDSERLLRRSSSDSFRVPSNLRVRIPQPTISISDSPDLSVRPPSSPGSRLKFEMDVSEESGQASSSPSSSSPKKTEQEEHTKDSPSSPSGALVPSFRNRLTQMQRKRNISISFAFHALSRNILGRSERESSRWQVTQTTSTSSPAIGKMEEAIMSRAASFKSDWLCPVMPTAGYRVDMGSTNVMELPTCMNIMDLDLDICYYHNEFMGQEHSNFLGTVRGSNGMPGKPVGISIKFVKESELTTAKFGEVTALVRTVERDERVTIAFHPNLLTSSNTAPSTKRLVKLLLKNVPRLKDAQLEEIRDPKLNDDFLKFETQLRITRYKFGVLYCADGQIEENDIYSNVTTSPDFKEFLHILGDNIELKGWKQFRGGLDVKNNTTGLHSVYTKWNDYEIMFHIGPLLPFDMADEQRVERKRHIGNDIVVLIFKDGASQINPAVFKSHFNHVFMIVQKDHAKSDVLSHYRVTFVCKDEVPIFGPMYPHSYSFPNTSKFREFIITKLVNAERGAMHTPVFFSKTKRTRQELLLGFINAYAAKK
eukprot:Phypoly_transcript_00586.p1 GENE.Phypoly_transcript_00586~~Phypoly_transcript_00586.p1  ORF type:complete len:908 (+),score=170.10 Phypoly_transcript_00586:1521-4244(+)